jgi:hypothetical protein
LSLSSEQEYSQRDALNTSDPIGSNILKLSKSLTLNFKLLTTSFSVLRQFIKEALSSVSPLQIIVSGKLAFKKRPQAGFLISNRFLLLIAKRLRFLEPKLLPSSV